MGMGRHTVVMLRSPVPGHGRASDGRPHHVAQQNEPTGDEPEVQVPIPAIPADGVERPDNDEYRVVPAQPGLLATNPQGQAALCDRDRIAASQRPRQSRTLTAGRKLIQGQGGPGLPRQPHSLPQSTARQRSAARPGSPTRTPPQQFGRLVHRARREPLLRGQHLAPRKVPTPPSLPRTRSASASAPPSTATLTPRPRQYAPFSTKWRCRIVAGASGRQQRGRHRPSHSCSRGVR